MDLDFYKPRFPFLITFSSGGKTHQSHFYASDESEAREYFVQGTAAYYVKIVSCVRDYDRSEVELAMLVCWRQKQLHGDTLCARQESARILTECKLKAENLNEGAIAVFEDWDTKE
jgi:hypothetical protein